MRESRRLLRAAREDAERLFDPDGGVRVLGVGELLPLGRAAGSSPSPPVDVARTIEEALPPAPLDFVHVHEPFAPQRGSVALRHSRALNVGTFHAPTERVLSTQVARRFVERFFGRLDARTASFAATRELMQRFFPADYRLLRPGATVRERPPRHAGRCGSRSSDEEERAALRLFLRALRRLPEELDWEAATVFTPTGAAPIGALRSRLRERVRVVSAAEAAPSEVLADADVVVAASLGQAPAPGLLVRALGAGAVPVAARLATYEEVLDDGELRAAVRAGRRATLAGQLERADRATPSCWSALRERVARGARRRSPGRASPTSSRRSTPARRAPPRPRRERRRCAARLAQAAADRRRPAHAHRPLARLRHAGRGAARHRARRRASARSR